jgi:glutamyl-tRNA reductase
MLGTSHERAPIEVRERLAVSGAAQQEVLSLFRPEAPEALILSTCNRTEVYLWTDPAVDGERLAKRLFVEHKGVPEDAINDFSRVARGRAAVRHLFRVASGLESLVLGEPQILGQVRDALDQARAAGMAGPHVSRMAMDALRTGKRARTETGIARNRTSVAHAGVDLAMRHLRGLSGRRAVVIGAGEMARLTAKLLRSRDVSEIVIANRSITNAEVVADVVGGRTVPLTRLGSELLAADVAFGVATTDSFLFDRTTLNGQLAARQTPLLAIDLGVPRNIDPALAEHAMIHLFDVDDLEVVAQEVRSDYMADIARVEEIVAEAVAAYMTWHGSRSVAPTVAALRKKGESLRDQEVAKALAKLSHLSERDQNVVRTMAASMTGKFLHAPVAHLGSAGPEVQAGDADAALRLFGLDVGASDD